MTQHQTQWKWEDREEWEEEDGEKWKERYLLEEAGDEIAGFVLIGFLFAAWAGFVVGVLFF